MELLMMVRFEALPNPWYSHFNQEIHRLIEVSVLTEGCHPTFTGCEVILGESMVWLMTAFTADPVQAMGVAPVILRNLTEYLGPVQQLHAHLSQDTTSADALIQGLFGFSPPLDE